MSDITENDPTDDEPIEADEGAPPDETEPDGAEPEETEPEPITESLPDEGAQTVTLSVDELAELVNAAVDKRIAERAAEEMPRHAVVLTRIECVFDETTGRFARDEETHPVGFLGGEATMWRRYDNGDWKLSLYQAAVRRTIARHNNLAYQSEAGLI